MNTSPELAYRDRTCTILGTNHNPLSLSLHNGQNDRTGEKYTLLRLGFAMHRTGEDILRIPYIDVNIAKKDKFILVEDIKSFVETLKNEKMFQEPLTELLAKKFSCRVVTFAVHQDVEVVCEIP